ncbi:MAG TPA: VWA domain-containing protein [Ktedonobacterales bacterium]|nr:VWA domain-containing protein [Ktedonobacterales bacterium]
MFPDYYAILGIDPGAALDEVKQAFRVLAHQHHPDVKPGDPKAGERFRSIYEAYQVLSSADLRAEYDQMRKQQYNGRAISWQPSRRSGTAPLVWREEMGAHPTFTPGFELNCTLSQKQTLVYPEEHLIYLLSELLPVMEGAVTGTIPLNLCLAIDRSSSMRGEKLRAVKMALRALVKRLQPGDVLSVVAFDNRAEVIVRAEARQIPDVMIAAIEQLHERGGTEIGQGLAKALEELDRFASQPIVSHLILLTDGQTYGDEERCLELAQKAHEQGISITALGIGTEWNEELLDMIADVSEGSADYLEGANDILTALDQHVGALRNTLATNVRLSMQMEGGVRIRRVTRVIPDFSELMDAAPSDQRWMLSPEVQLDIGSVPATGQECALALLWEILLPANARGHYILGQLEAQYDIPSARLLDQKKSARVAVDFVEMMPPTGLRIPAKVKQAIEYVTAYRLQNKARERIDQGDHAGASTLLQTAALRLRAADQEDLAEEAQAQAQQLQQQQVPERSAALKLKYDTKNLFSRQKPKKPENGKMQQ